MRAETVKRIAWSRQGDAVDLAYSGPWKPGYRWALGCLFVAAAAFHLFSLVRMPPPFADDAWYSSRGWSLIHQGQAFSPLDAGVLNRLDGYWTYFPWLGAWCHSLAIRALGLSLFSVRLVSLVFGLLILLAVYTIGHRLSDRWTAFLSVFLVSSSGAFFQSAHLARPDVMVAALGYVAIALSVPGRSRNLSLQSVLSGLAVGLAFEIHPNAVIYGPAIAALFVLDHGWSVWKTGRFWGLVGGLAVGLLFWAAMHVLRYPATYLAITNMIVGSSRVPPLLVPNPRLWVESLVHTSLLFVRMNSYRTPLVVAAVAYMGRRSSPGDRRLLLLFGVLILGLAALVRNKASYYAILVCPAADLLLAAFAVRLLRDTRRTARAGVASRLVSGLLWVCLAGLLAASIAYNLRPLRRNPLPEYHATVERIAEAVPPQSSLMATQTYWLGLPRDNYQSWDNLVYFRHHVPGSSLEDAFLALRPDYLIVDAHMEEFVVEDPGGLSDYYRFVHIPRAELEQFLARRARLVTQFDTELYGRVRVYSMDWSWGSSSENAQRHYLAQDET